MRYLRGSRRDSRENDVHIPAQSVKGEIYRRKNHDGYRDVKQRPRRGRERDHGEGVNGRDEQHVLPRIAQPGKKPQRQRAAELVHGREQHRCRRLQCVAGRLRGRKHISARRMRARPPLAYPRRFFGGNFSVPHPCACRRASARSLPKKLFPPLNAIPSATRKIFRPSPKKSSAARNVSDADTLFPPEWACSSGKTGFTSRGECCTPSFPSGFPSPCRTKFKYSQNAGLTPYLYKSF